MIGLGKCGVCKIVGALLVLGGLNWGLIALFDFNLVTKVLGDATIATRIAYGLVGVAGLITLISCFKPCPCCKKAPTT